MAASLHKFLKKSSSLRLITTVKPSPHPSIPLLQHQSQSLDSKSNDPNPFWCSDKSHQSPLRFYPTFSLGSFLNQPISISRVNNQLEEEIEAVDGGDVAGKIWADSVKKKRKRKMNKHKYKKLRKRLRRKT
ncbi:hypothetical protein ACHQM5_010878 [Ranunculus cassubicifolius]